MYFDVSRKEELFFLHFRLMYNDVEDSWMELRLSFPRDVVSELNIYMMCFLLFLDDSRIEDKKTPQSE